MIKTLLITTALLTSSFASGGVSIVKQMSRDFQEREEQDLINDKLPKMVSKILLSKDIPDSLKNLNVRLWGDQLVINTYSKINDHLAGAICDAVNSNMITKEEGEGINSFERNYVWDNDHLKDKYGIVYFQIDMTLFPLDLEDNEDDKR